MGLRPKIERCRIFDFGCDLVKKKRLTARIFRISHVLLHSEQYFLRSRMKSTDFTRKRKLGFVDYMIYLLSGVKVSLQAGLNQYLDMRNRTNETYSKQAFSKGRERIRPEAFKELSDTVALNVYPLAETSTWNGYHLLAIDGSRLNLPLHPETEKDFGSQITGGNPQPQALCSCLLDVLNELVIDARIGPCRDSERDHAKDMIRSLNTEIVHNPLYLMDRGYPSGELMALIGGLGQKYLMRCDKSFIRAIQRDGNDVIVTHQFSKLEEPIEFRVITIKSKSPDGESETEDYLVTNVLDDQYQIQDFVELYHLRWGIETKYNDLKNKLQIENFTGITPVAIRQDFFATLYLVNLAGVLAIDYRDDIEAAHNTPENKHTYKLNVNLTIAALKQDVVSLLLYRSPSVRDRLLFKIERRLQNAVVPIRPNRSFERKRKHVLLKHPSNTKLP